MALDSDHATMVPGFGKIETAVCVHMLNFNHLRRADGFAQFNQNGHGQAYRLTPFTIQQHFFLFSQTHATIPSYLGPEWGSVGKCIGNTDMGLMADVVIRISSPLVHDTSMGRLMIIPIISVIHYIPLHKSQIWSNKWLFTGR